VRSVQLVNSSSDKLPDKVCTCAVVPAHAASDGSVNVKHESHKQSVKPFKVKRFLSLVTGFTVVLRKHMQHMDVMYNHIIYDVTYKYKIVSADNLRVQVFNISDSVQQASFS
jgi:hypothetical protein